MKVRIKKLHPNAQIPVRSEEFAGGWDLTCTEIIKITDDFYICKLGLAMQPEDFNYKITIVPRSSQTKTKLILQNIPILGDPSFTGEYKLCFRVLPTDVKKDDDTMWGYRLIYPEFPFQVGNRIAQMYLEEIIPVEFDEFSDFIETSRGSGGFGSTGK